MGRKESNQTNKTNIIKPVLDIYKDKNSPK